MHNAELYKLRSQRTPLLTAATLAIGSIIPAIVFLFYTPSNTDVYGGAFTATYLVLAPLLSIVFGGWLLGTEYRQDTVKRMLATEPRRLRALAAKATVGFAALAATLTVSAGLGWTATRFVASMNDVTIPWNGGELFQVGMIAVGAAVVAFGLSALTKSDSFAMVGTVGLMLVLDPVLSLIPRVGKYTLMNTLDVVTSKLAGVEATNQLSLTTGSIGLAAWLAAALLPAAYLFARRDV